MAKNNDTVQDLVFGLLHAERRPMNSDEVTDKLEDQLLEAGCVAGKLHLSVRPVLTKGWQKGLLHKIGGDGDDARYGIPEYTKGGVVYVDRRKGEITSAVRYLWLQQTLYLRKYCVRKGLDQGELDTKVGEALRYAFLRVEQEFKRTVALELLPAIAAADLEGLPELPEVPGMPQ